MRGGLPRCLNEAVTTADVEEPERTTPSTETPVGESRLIILTFHIHVPRLSRAVIEVKQVQAAVDYLMSLVTQALPRVFPWSNEVSVYWSYDTKWAGQDPELIKLPATPQNSG